MFTTAGLVRDRTVSLDRLGFGTNAPCVGPSHSVFKKPTPRLFQHSSTRPWHGLAARPGALRCGPRTGLSAAAQANSSRFILAALTLAKRKFPAPSARVPAIISSVISRTRISKCVCRLKSQLCSTHCWWHRFSRGTVGTDAPALSKQALGPNIWYSLARLLPLQHH